ncbi:hypothetical protein RRG08_025395 [Elysia crispata]|uniref:Uncharacterized protein n=1 Tax=Elysia crispata TaxID=231223 RepID=A0AAE1B6W1_9GAST|nr:hypothetical protein RRG08_025395 [Elysia crispata]
MYCWDPNHYSKHYKVWLAVLSVSNEDNSPVTVGCWTAQFVPARKPRTSKGHPENSVKLAGKLERTEPILRFRSVDQPGKHKDQRVAIKRRS